MNEHTSPASSFTTLPLGIVFDDRMTGERAEITAPGVAVYRPNAHMAEEVISVTRGRALVWALRVREALHRDAYGFLWGSVGLTLEKELDLGQWGLFALRISTPVELAQAAD